MAKIQTLKKKKLYNRVLYIFLVQSLRLGHFAPFDCQFLLIGTPRAKDLRKNEPVLQEGRSTLALPTPLVIWVVLLNTKRSSLNPFIHQLYLLGHF